MEAEGVLGSERWLRYWTLGEKTRQHQSPLSAHQQLVGRAFYVGESTVWLQTGTLLSTNLLSSSGWGSESPLRTWLGFDSGRRKLPRGIPL